MQKEKLSGWISLIIVYVVWGSTYLAIRIAVQPGAGFEPFTLVTMRLLVSAGVLFLLAAVTRQKMKIPRGERLAVLLPGIFQWLAGNGFVTWAEKTVNSGYAALMVATTIIWVTIFESLIEKRRLSAKTFLILSIGFAGLVFLNVPALRGAEGVDGFGVLILLVASISWGIGTLIQKYRRTSLTPTVSSAYQQLIGGIAVLAMRFALNEPLPRPTPAAWAAWVYLVVFGGVLAYTAFIIAVRNLPTRIVMTYSYVNPLVALFLGWIVLREEITVWTLVGAGLIVLSVFGIYKTKSTNTARN